MKDFIDLDLTLKEISEIVARDQYLHPLELDDVQQLKADALALLKEQEAVEPITDSARNRRCPKCNTILKGKFCHECGQEVKWNG